MKTQKEKDAIKQEYALYIETCKQKSEVLPRTRFAF